MKMINSKLQAALDEIERLYATVKEFKHRNGTLPESDSDAGRSWFALQEFTVKMRKFDVAQLGDPAPLGMRT